MADISLRDYLAKLDSLLSSDSAPAVILHARHILQQFPRNAQTYRMLGRSLVATGRWPEAAEVMRRVLSVFPDDKDAHVGMSEVYRLEKRADDAIWHLERAFEQSPNDQKILDNLRDLYRKHRKVEHGKVQLTAGAVARQYVRNGLYEQALDTLQKAIAATPERVDLRLLLAQTYWDAGRRVEAGETAFEVLKSLPDCLVANTLMAALWLTEARPSDAQRYINRMQSLDPYLALELAQGQDVPDDAFTLSELDYQKAAERELIAQTPEWLKGIDAATAASMSADLDSRTDADEIMAGEGLRRSRTTEPGLFDELGEPDTLFDEQTQPPPGAVTAQRSGLTDRLTKPQTNSLPGERPVPGPKKGLTGRFAAAIDEPLKEEPLPSFMADLTPAASVEAALQDAEQDELPDWLTNETAGAGDIDAAAQDELPDWLQASAPADEADELPFQRQRTVEPDQGDPLAWLRDSGIEVVENSVAADDDIYDAVDSHLALQDADAADPLSWMQSYGGKDMLVDSSADFDETRLIDEAVTGDDDGDPLAWLHQPGTPAPAASMDEPVDYQNAPVTAGDDDDPLAWLQQADNEFTQGAGAVADSTEEDALDWLSDDTLLDEAFDLESLVNNQVTPPEPLTYVASVSPTAEMPEGQNVMPDEKDPLDWLSSNEAEPESGSDEAFTWADEAQSFDEPVAEAELPDWLTNTEEVQGSLETGSPEDLDDQDWMSNLPPAEGETPAPAKIGNTGMLDWLNKQPAQTSLLPPTPTAGDIVPDWLSEMQTEIEGEPAAVPAVDENGFEWMSQSDDMPSAVSADAAPPDWLSEINIAQEAEDLVDDEPLVAADVPDWLTQSQMGDEQLVETQLAAADSMPDWLGELDGGAVDAVAGEAVTPMDDTPEWLSEMEDAVPAAVSDTPEWLADLKPNDVTPAESLDIAPDWLSGLATSDAEELPEPDTVTQMPDQIQNWVANVRAQSDDAGIENDTPEWLAAMQPEETTEAEPEPMMGDTPDWLSAMKPEDDAPQAEPVASDIPDWLSAMEPESEEQPEAEPAMSETPSWLADLEPENEDQLQTEPEPAMSDTPDWLSALEPEGEEQPEAEPVMSDTPDWLSAMEPESEEQPEAEPAMSDTPDWLSAMEPESEEQPEAEPVMSDTPDWLSAMEPEGEEQPQAEPVMSDTPDWLSAMEPEGEEQPEAEPVMSDTPGWLTELQPEAETPAETPTVLSDEPDWLAAMHPEDEADVEPQPMMSDTPDWLSSIPSISQPEEQAAAELSDEPDWLTAMQAETNSMLEPEPEPAVSTTPEWLADLEPEAPEPVQAQPEPIVDTTPGWLADMQLEAIDEATVESAESLSDEPEWLTDLQSEEEAEDEAVLSDEPDWLTAMQAEPTLETEVEPEAVISDTPDWLADLQPEEPEVVEPEPELLSSETPDWLAAMQTAGAAATEPDTMVDDEPDWLTNMKSDGNLADTPAPMTQRPASSAVTRDLSDWTGAQELDFDPAAAPSDEPDWLTDMATSAVEEPSAEVTFDDEAELEGEAAAETATEMPDWLSAMRPAEEPVESAELESTYDWEDEAADGETMPAAPAPAENAPDWLNAMVPGLDVDYEAEEDQPLETEFLPGSENRVTPVIAASSPRTKPEYSWLLDIVQEESQQIRAVGQRSVRRFVFSQLPAWLRKPTEVRDEPTDEVDADNVDIPPWLQ